MYDEHKEYVAKVREMLAKVDRDAPAEFGVQQTSYLTGNAYYVAEFDRCKDKLDKIKGECK